MIQFTQNAGQFHAQVAWVAPVPKGWPRCGLCIATLEHAQIKTLIPSELALDYWTADDITQAEAEGGGPYLISGPGELVVLHGTKLAALLNATGGRL